MLCPVMRRPSARSGVRGVGLLLLLMGLAAAGLPAPAGAGPAPEPLRQAAEGLVGNATQIARSLSPAAEPTRPAKNGEELAGLFRLTAADCGGAAVSGTYFRMNDPGGGLVQNTSSGCVDKTYTDLAPGRDGGLSTVDYQPNPNPAFDSEGNGANDRITLPQGFFGPRFSTATNPKDPQTGLDVPLPKVVHDGAGKLAGDLRAFAAAYQRQHFNQGSPKPDGSTPGRSRGPTGTYDPATRKFTLEWSSTIVGGPFNNFTGTWHFEGVFEPAKTTAGDGEDPGPGEQPPDEGGLPPLLPLPLAGASAVSLAPPAPAAAASTATARVAGQVAAGELKGVFRITPASCSSGPPTGTFFRMIQPGGNVDAGPYLPNNDSTCADKTYTDLSPGKDGGLSTVAYQPQPNPPFDANGGGANDRITMPKKFFGAFFATATNETDPQASGKTALPSIVFDGAGKLSGDLRAFAAAYQNQHFNQGSPKPDGSKPGLTAGPTGTFDPSTNKFSLEWTSTIVGGPFDKFTGKWHFEGTYEPAAAAVVPTTPTGGGGTTTSPAAASPTSGAGAGTQVAAPGTSVPPESMAQTGPPWSARLPASLLALGLVFRRVSRRMRSAVKTEGQKG